MVELLDAQAAETQSALALSQARWGAIVAAAERRRALGLDPGVARVARRHEHRGRASTRRPAADSSQTT